MSRVVVVTRPVNAPVVLAALLLAAVIFAAAGALAMLLPARRALDVAPAVALRVD